MIRTNFQITERDGGKESQVYGGKECQVYGIDKILDEIIEENLSN